MLAGYIAEMTTHEGPNRGFHKIIRFTGGFFPARITNTYNQNEFDFLEVGVHAGKKKNVPFSYGGLSGGRLWQIILEKSDDGQIIIKDIILSGVVFYESDLKNETRYITCNGRQSIYKVAYEIIKKEF